MNAHPGPASGEAQEVRFDNGNRATLVIDDGARPAELASRLGLGSGDGGRPVIVVCGGADDLKDGALRRTEAVLGPAVTSAARLTGAAVVDGGTAAGVMAVMGAARARQGDGVPVLLGVAPEGTTTYPGAPAGDRVRLEQHHTHFALADSAEWGGETGLLVGMAEALAGDRPVVVVLAGGGAIAEKEMMEAVHRGWPVFVIHGTGGLADTVLALRETHRRRRRRRLARLNPHRLAYRKLRSLSSIDHAGLHEILDGGCLRRISGPEPGTLARRLSWELQDDPVLKAAWSTFATYDGLAARLRATFERVQASILLLGVLATLLALVHRQVGGAALHWAVVAAPIVASVLIALANRRAPGRRWVLLRAAAEAIKTEIYRYRTRTGEYAGGRSADETETRAAEALAARLDAIEARLMQTDASSGPLTPYDGPLPPEMYGAGRDDDGLSRLDAARYLEIRVGDQLTYYHDRVRGLARRRDVFQLLAVAGGGVGAILAAAGLEIWIGLTTAISAAALAYTAYLQVDNTVIAYNQSAGRLTRLLRGWRARGAGQGPAAFDDLVAGGEAVLTMELAGWVQQMNDALHELRNRQADAARQVTAGTPESPPAASGEDPGPA